MPALIDTFTMANGVHIPKIGFGTWQIPDGPEAYEATAAALEAGYRHIDTARAYGNEASVGRAIRDSGIPRDEVFITTKLPAEVKDADRARATFEVTMEQLGMEQIDLYLIHAPWPWSAPHTDHREGNIAVWKVFEELYDAGRTRSIGVSNFDVADLESLTSATDITPHANQIRWFVGNTQDETTAYCQERDILVEGYSPLATGGLLDSPELARIAANYGKSVAQLSIRYLLEKDVLPLPKSTTPSRIVENADVDFELTPEDIATLDGLSDPTKD
jgi:diketogulonate reductase-like aldo/keto reductase